MARKRLAFEDLPGWPRVLSFVQAAAYVGASPDLFAYELRCGKWPAPLRRGPNQGLSTWDRAALDLALDRISELATPNQVNAPHPVIPAGEITRRIHAQATQRRTEARQKNA